MKKILSTLTATLAAALVLTGCQREEDDIFSATAAERLNESSAKYSARLEAQPNGWAMQYYPTYDNESPYGSGYLILMDFNEDYSVRVAMNNRFTGNVYDIDVSAWEVIKDNGPVLSFNSFNRCMHAFSDPEDIPWTEDNEQSEGCGGDYEFIIVDAPEDASYMMLKGKKRNTYNLLTPIEEGVDYEEYLADVKAFHSSVFRENELASLLMHFGDTIYRMDESYDGLPNIYPYDADAIANESFHPFLVTKRGEDYYVRFRDAFQRDDMSGTLQELRYDTLTQEFVGTDNPAWRITPYPAQRFFAEYLYQSAQNAWTIAKAGEMAELWAGQMTNLDAQFGQIKDPKDRRKRSYSFLSLSLSRDSKTEQFVWSVNYKAPSSSTSSSAKYVFEASQDGDIVTFRYVEPFDEDAGNVAGTVPAITEAMPLLSQSFRVEAAALKYNLARVKLTAVDNPELWFVVNI